VFAQIAASPDPAAWISVRDREDVRREAAALAAGDRERLPLWGVPFAVKDNIDVAGLDTTAACRPFAYRPAADATAVARLRAAGALVIGKTNLDQFATGLVGVRSPYGIPRCVFDPAYVSAAPAPGPPSSSRAGRSRSRSAPTPPGPAASPRPSTISSA
jgi:allophanate hydrolase